MKLHKIATTIDCEITSSIYMFDDIIATHISKTEDTKNEDLLIRYNEKELYIEYRPTKPVFVNNDNILLYYQNKAVFNMVNDTITEITFDLSNPVHNMIVQSIKQLLDINIFDLNLHPEYLKTLTDKEPTIQEVLPKDCIPFVNPIKIEHTEHYFDVNKHNRTWHNTYEIQSERYGELNLQVNKMKNKLNEWYKVTITGLKTQNNEPLECIFGDIIPKKQDLRCKENEGQLLTGIQKTNLVYEELSPLLNAIATTLKLYLPCIDNNAFNTTDYEPPAYITLQ